MEYNQKGKVIARYVHGAGVDEPLAVDLPLPLLRKEGTKGRSNIYYYHADGLGSITALTDAKGKVVQRYDYDSFGKLKRHGHKVKQPYTYTAREYDRETGLYYYRARYYDAKVGRFISKDPILNPLNPMTIGLSRSANLMVWMAPYLISSPKILHPYIYVGNAPTIYTDSTGLIGWDTVIKQVLKQVAKRLLKEWSGDPIERGAEEERKALEQFYLEQYKRCLEGCGGEGRCDTEECKEKCYGQYTRDMERLKRAFR
jgi:RHS repeat-associated protein